MTFWRGHLRCGMAPVTLTGPCERMDRVDGESSVGYWAQTMWCNASFWTFGAAIVSLNWIKFLATNNPVWQDHLQRWKYTAWKNPFTPRLAICSINEDCPSTIIWSMMKMSTMPGDKNQTELSCCPTFKPLHRCSWKKLAALKQLAWCGRPSLQVSRPKPATTRCQQPQRSLWWADSRAETLTYMWLNN